MNDLKVCIDISRCVTFRIVSSIVYLLHLFFSLLEVHQIYQTVLYLSPRRLDPHLATGDFLTSRSTSDIFRSNFRVRQYCLQSFSLRRDRWERRGGIVYRRTLDGSRFRRVMSVLATNKKKPKQTNFGLSRSSPLPTRDYRNAPVPEYIRPARRTMPVYLFSDLFRISGREHSFPFKGREKNSSLFCSNDNRHSPGSDGILRSK